MRRLADDALPTFEDLGAALGWRKRGSTGLAGDRCCTDCSYSHGAVGVVSPLVPPGTCALLLNGAAEHRLGWKRCHPVGRLGQAVAEGDQGLAETTAESTGGMAKAGTSTECLDVRLDPGLSFGDAGVQHDKVEMVGLHGGVLSARMLADLSDRNHPVISLAPDGVAPRRDVCPAPSLRALDPWPLDPER